MTDRLPWFRCGPSALLGALAGLQPDEGLVYVTVLLRIYETGGPIADSARSLARRTGLSERRTGAAIESLAMTGKIQMLGDERIDSASTHDELAWQRQHLETKAAAGRASGNSRAKEKTRAKIDRQKSAEKSEQHQGPGRTPAQQSLTDLDRDTEEDIGSLSHARPLAPDWQPDAEDEAAALAEGLLASAIPREARQFLDWNLERHFRSHDWRASWRKWCRSPYRASDPNTRAGRPRGQGPPPDRPTGMAGRLIRLHEQSLSGAYDVEPPSVDANEPGAEPSRGEDRGLAWSSGGPSRPSDALLRAAGEGGHDSRASRALRMRRAAGS